MSRGGKRKGAGRPSSWKSGCRFEETKLVRVPSKIADQVLEFAHLVDEGHDFFAEMQFLKQENEILNQSLGLLVRRNSELCNKLAFLSKQ